MSQVETLTAQPATDFSPASDRAELRGAPFDAGYTDVDDVVAASLREPAPEGEHIFPDLPPLHYGHPDVHVRNGIMAAERLAAEHEPDAEKAFFVADLSEVYRQHQRWLAALPEIHPYYAVKCNPDPYVLRLLAALGANFDCASHGEIAQVLALGVDPARIIFANPCKAASFVRRAGALGVHTMTFDNADELHKIARTHPAAQLVLRVLADDAGSLCPLGRKYGAPLAAVPALLARARALRLAVVGVSFHVGSGAGDPAAFADAVARARAAFDMGAAAGFAFGVLDVGGGFGDASFEAAARVLRGALDAHFPDRRALRVIAEPGRFYVARAFRLATSVIARRAPADADADADAGAGDADAGDADAGDADAARVMYYINDGVYGAFNCILFDHQHPAPHVLTLGGSFHVAGGAAAGPASVWGPTCDSLDCVCAAVALPRALRVGDWLGWRDMGAYTVCAASQFNGFAVSRVVYTAGAGAAGAGAVRRVLAAFAAGAGAGAAGAGAAGA